MDVTRDSFDAFVTPWGSAEPPSLEEEPIGAGDAPRSVGLRYPVASPEWVASLCDRLGAARSVLTERGAGDLVGVLGGVGERFLDPEDPLRRRALDLMPPTAGLSPQMAAFVLDGMARDWTRERLAALLQVELGGPAALDGFVGAPRPRAGAPGRRAMAVGPAMCVQVVAGSVPGVGVNALLRSLLVKGPTLLKPGRGDVVLPVLFARGLAEMDAALAGGVAVVYWPGGSRSMEDAALARADVVVAYGADDTVRDLRDRAPVTARFVAYHHRLSVGVVGRESLGPARCAGAAADVARAIAAFDQRGCVSPQLVLVEDGGECSPLAFAELLAQSLRDLEPTLPTAPLGPAEGSRLHQARGTAELMAAADGPSVFHGGRAAWTVVFEGGSGTGARTVPVPAAGRFARVRPIASLEELPGLIAPFAAHLQTIAVSGLGGRLEAVAHRLARVGASRVVPFPSAPFPPPWWHHDGRGPLTDLVRWIDLEPE